MMQHLETVEIDGDESVKKKHDPFLFATGLMSHTRDQHRKKKRRKKDIPCTQPKTTNDCGLLRRLHVELPHGPDGQEHDEEVGHDVGHDQGLEDQDLVHALLGLAVDGPLRLDRGAQEDGDKGQDDGPDEHDDAGPDDPPLELRHKHPPVQAALAQLHKRQRPQVHAHKGKGVFENVLEVVVQRRKVWRLGVKVVADACSVHCGAHADGGHGQDLQGDFFFHVVSC